MKSSRSRAKTCSPSTKPSAAREPGQHGLGEQRRGEEHRRAGRRGRRVAPSRTASTRPPRAAAAGQPGDGGQRVEGDGARTSARRCRPAGERPRARGPVPSVATGRWVVVSTLAHVRLGLGPRVTVARYAGCVASRSRWVPRRDAPGRRARTRRRRTASSTSGLAVVTTVVRSRSGPGRAQPLGDPRLGVGVDRRWSARRAPGRPGRRERPGQRDPLPLAAGEAPAASSTSSSSPSAAPRARRRRRRAGRAGGRRRWPGATVELVAQHAGEQAWRRVGHHTRRRTVGGGRGGSRTPSRRTSSSSASRPRRWAIAAESSGSAQTRAVIGPGATRRPDPGSTRVDCGAGSAEGHLGARDVGVGREHGDDPAGADQGRGSSCRPPRPRSGSAPRGRRRSRRTRRRRRRRSCPASARRALSQTRTRKTPGRRTCAASRVACGEATRTPARGRPSAPR